MLGYGPMLGYGRGKILQVLNTVTLTRAFNKGKNIKTTLV